MKWVNGYTYEVKIRRKEQWHKWFAWYPVTVEITSEGRQIKAWLQHIMRKGTHFGSSWEQWWTYEYKEIGK
jgi:hypothetical protein